MPTNIDPRDWLNEAKAAADAGRFQDALQKHIQFHDHALEHQPSLYGVRLSFALSYWMELAAVYPDAGRALREIRDRKAHALLNGDGDRELFHDVVAINEALGRETQTHELFVALNHANTIFAAECAQLALPAIVKAGDFKLARQLMPAPEDEVRRLSLDLNEDIQKLEASPRTSAPRLDAYIHIYADDIKCLLEILEGTGKSEEATRIKAMALDLVNSFSAREAIRGLLAKA